MTTPFYIERAIARVCAVANGKGFQECITCPIYSICIEELRESGHSV